MAPNRSQTRFPGLLAATAMGVYLLVLVGTTTALTDAASACAAWPACGDGWTLPTGVDGLLVLGHRVAAVLVGLLGAVTVVSGWRHARPRVRIALVVAAVLYPVQAALGAVVAVRGGSSLLSTAHLVVGVVIFGGVLAALAWTLERLTGDPDDAPESPPERDLPPAGGRDPAVPSAMLPRLRATLAAYARLTKPRLMWLLCLVAAAAMALAGGAGFTVRTVLLTLGGGVLSIGASGTFNHVLERDVDRRMNRTNDRPVATALVPVEHAVAFGLALALGSLALFAAVNLLVAVLGLVAIVFYSVIYTLLLKPNTVQNTVVGGAAGALPALIGWAAVTGTVGVGGLLLATLVFVWTPAHFYNLALAYKDDYARGGFPMMPLVRGETETRKQILGYLGATLATAAALVTVPALDWLFVAATVVAGAVFLAAVVALHYERTEAAALRSFHASNAYLGLTLLAVLFDGLVV